MCPYAFEQCRLGQHDLDMHKTSDSQIPDYIRHTQAYARLNIKTEAYVKNCLDSNPIA